MSELLLQFKQKKSRKMKRNHLVRKTIRTRTKDIRDISESNSLIWRERYTREGGLKDLLILLNGSWLKHVFRHNAILEPRKSFTKTTRALATTMVTGAKT